MYTWLTPGGTRRLKTRRLTAAYRIGQHKNVIAVRLICPDTIEEKMVKLQENKRDLAGMLIQSDTSIFKTMTKNDLLGLLNQPS
jgi:SNF2 family DNA or RNA helicase